MLQNQVSLKLDTIAGQNIRNIILFVLYFPSSDLSYITNRNRNRRPKPKPNRAYRSLTTERYSDDGEPSGTAGRPILGILEAENMIDTVVVVSRYFGGIKLGRIMTFSLIPW